MRDQTRQMVLTAMFSAIILLLGMTPLGLIPLGFINVTILCVPVIIGTIILGLGRGLMLGIFFGLCSTLSMYGMSMTPPSSLAAAVLLKSPLLAIIMCMVPRILVPVATHFTYRFIAGGDEISRSAVPTAAVVGSMTNTIFYLGLMLWFYKILNIEALGLLTIIGGVGAIAGTAEAVVAALISGAVVYALWKQERKI